MTPVAECVHDSDCTNPDSAHCDVSCGSKDGVRACVTKGKDHDGDGFFASSCIAAPGDDCNDADKATHPGAAETCDGVDNDCNGKIDISDGLTVSGKNVSLSSNTQVNPQIVWAPDKSVYALALLDRTSHFLTLETVDKTGQVSLMPIIVSPAGTPASDVSLTWGGNSLGVTWGWQSKVTFEWLGSSGALLDSYDIAKAAVPYAFDGLGLTRTTLGRWVGTYIINMPGGLRLLMGKTFTDKASVPADSDAKVIVDHPVLHPHTAAVGIKVAVVYDVASSDTASGMLLDQALVPSKTLILSGRQPVVGASGDGFAVAVSAANADGFPLLYAFDSTGAAKCGPTKLGGPSVAPTSIVATATGYLVVLGSANGVEVQQVMSDCSPGQRFTIDATASSNAALAGGSAGYGIVWGGAGGLNFRAFGLNFCD